MANHKSALKRVRQNENRRVRNKARKTRVKNLTKSAQAALEEKSLVQAVKRLRLAQKVIDQSAARGVLHRRTAARKISRLSKKVQALANSQAAEAVAQ